MWQILGPLFMSGKLEVHDLLAVAKVFRPGQKNAKEHQTQMQLLRSKQDLLLIKTIQMSNLYFSKSAKLVTFMLIS